jgi:purine-nucleoside phosphorylase
MNGAAAHTALIADAVELIQWRTSIGPRVAVVLGSGLGAFAEALGERVEIAYSDIPGWPVPRVAGHAGKIVLGRVGETPVAALAGRAHLYEGHSAQRVAYGVEVLHALGVHTLILTNAAGGITDGLTQGSLVLISDHINLQGENPLPWPESGFPDMTEVYSLSLRAIAREAGHELGLDLSDGVYAGLRGPSYETPAEIRYLRAIGADLVGMSTVAEAIMANYLGLQVLGISCVTNLAAGLSGKKLDHAEVLETGNRVRGALVDLLRLVIPRAEAAWTA